MTRRLPPIFTLAFITLYVILLSRQTGPLPPPGNFFHPSQGFWANAETRGKTGTMELSVDGLQEPVEIFFDDRGVPHIFARNNHDLYFAQGYVVARDRLFQMELQVRSAAGRLSEWLGDRTLDHDLYQRRFGMVYGTEQTVEAYTEGPELESVRAYAAGVNAYAESLSPADYPVEYKILNVRPGSWDVLMGSYLMNYMVQMLAGYSRDVPTTNTIAYLGENFVNRYISTRSKWMDPVIPPDHDWDFAPLQAQNSPDPFVPGQETNLSTEEPNPGIGSNNWAVHGSKTAGGYAILAGDPHLNMSIPSIWYEMQLNAPGINVYGVTIPGAPGIIKGFTEGVAWINTNTGTDVLDWYEVEFRDETMTEYLFDGEWLPTQKRVEVIEVKGREAVTDTIIYTHHGPVVQARGQEPMRSQVAAGHAMRWIGHNPNTNYIAYYHLNRARTVDEATRALNHFIAPAQNFALADTSNNIAMVIAGRFPLKWEFQGRTIGNGRDPLYDWQGFIPFEHNPRVLNPPRGFVSSANQYLTSESYPYYTDDNFAPFERGRRINDLLSGMDNISAGDMQRMQMDSYSYHAHNALPVMLAYLDESGLSPEELQAAGLLQGWDFLNTGSSVEPTVFHTWWRSLYRSIWDDLYNRDVPMRWPTRDRTVQMMIEEPDSPFYNDTRTDSTETLADLVNSSFRTAIETLAGRYGQSDESRIWARVNNTSLNHLGQIPGMGIYNLHTDGSAESINAISGSHGPSWRMIAEMDPDGVRGYGVYPGGQSGNPGSKNYGEFVEAWRTGELYELLFLRNQPENNTGFPLVMRLN